MEIGVRQQVVDGDEEPENGAQRDHERERVGDGAVAGDPRGVMLEDVEADRPCEQPDEERHEQRDKHQHREPFAAQKRSVRPPVDDIECRLEHAEEGERRPEQGDAADDPQRRCVPLHGLDRLHDCRDRGPRKDLLQLSHEVARLVGASRQPEQREREKGQRHEGKQREVGDHGREVGPAVPEELGQRAIHDQWSIAVDDV